MDLKRVFWIFIKTLMMDGFKMSVLDLIKL